MDYKNIIGHKRAIEALKNSVKNNTVSHSYLFQGEEGLGKKMVAYVFAKTLLCKEGKEEPCNRCVSCVKFDSENHPDFFLIQPDKGLIRKGQIEELVKNVGILPFESKRKVFIIDDSHKMNLEGKNTLLKTLEEPPSYVTIILISSSINNLLPTILSRCQSVKFYPVSSLAIEDYLTRMYSKTVEEASFVSNFTKGSVGKSIFLSTSPQFFQMRDEVVKILDSLIKGDKTKVFSAMGFFNENKDNVEEIIDIILYWFRDLLIYKEIGKSHLIINKDKLEYLSSQSFMDFNLINDIIVKVEETKDNIRKNVNYQLSIETMLLSI
ncbi:MAG: DNA polymerase III subunit delta' [Tissierellia bacterium]|nr:DNA polymerase III subunit delta' [Tissierellia bacterium]